MAVGAANRHSSRLQSCRRNCRQCQASGHLLELDSDIKLTAKVYTDETQLPIYEAIKGLPRLGDYTQIRAQILGAEWQNVAQPVATGEG